MSIARFAVNAPVKVTMLFVAVMLLGWISLSRLPTNLFPDVRAPKITVTVRTQGLSPGEVEKRVCENLERSLYSVRGVQEVESIARADSAVVVVNFNWETRMEYAFLEVKKATSDLQRQNPTEVTSVNVLRYDPNATPIVTVALEAPEGTDLEAMYRTADQSLRPRFERLEGVASVLLTGGMEREILVTPDEGLMLAYDVQMSAIVEALKADNVDATGGWVQEGARRYLLKTVGEFRSNEEIGRVTVGRKGDAAILVSDVAKVELVPKEAKSLVYLNGVPAIGMGFYREAESNTVAVAKLVRDEIEASQNILPQGWKLVVASDQSVFISQAIGEVRSNAITGGLLAVLVLLLFLRELRSTLIIALSIPVSIIATFTMMYFQGVSLNLMSLGGLALGSGMLVDNAIVVLENIFRLRHEGRSARDAAMQGTQEVAGALLASTLTTVAVFLPMVYVRGVAALLFREQALTVVYSLLASLLVALLLIPMLAALFLGQVPVHLQGMKETLRMPTGLYARTLGLALKLRFLVMAGAVAAAVWSGWLAAGIAREFLPSTDVPQLTVRVTMPNGTPIESTDRVASTITAQIRRYEPFLENVLVRVGEPEGAVNASTEDPDGPNTAELLVMLKSTDEPTTAMLAMGYTEFGSRRLVSSLKPVLDVMEDVKTEFRTDQGSMTELVGGTKAPLLLELSGPELDVLTQLVRDAEARLRDVPELLNVRTNILQGAPEVRLRLDKGQLSRYGLDVNSFATQLRQRLDGSTATQIRRESGDVDIRVQMDQGREGLALLEAMTLRTPTGALVRVGSLAEVETSRSPREVVRKRQQRVAYVMADLAEGVKLSEGIDRARQVLAPLKIPTRYSLRYSGEEEQRRAAFGDLNFALILSIALVYMVMASIFESFAQPFLILFTIPLSGIGVVWGLMAVGQTINIMSIIGVIMLGGIVVNNAIVLLDCVNQVRADAGRLGATELTARETLIIGCVRRLRPVLMTTATTLLGLLPMALGFGEGAELRQSMAVTVFGGLTSSTLLTLFVIPCAQSYLDSAFAVVRRVGAWWHRPRPVRA